MTIGEKLKNLRKNESRKKVAEKLGITESSLSNYENDYRIPRDEIKKKIACYYGVSIESIFFSE